MVDWNEGPRKTPVTHCMPTIVMQWLISITMAPIEVTSTVIVGSFSASYVIKFFGCEK